MAKALTQKSVEDFKHDEDTRKNIPTAELQSVMGEAQKQTVQRSYERRNRDLDPQLVWRGKDDQDKGDLVVNAPSLFIQEKVHPKALIDDLLRHTREGQHEQGQITADLFSDFNGIPKDADKTEFYQHDQNWTNRMILGDSLQVMASLAEREGLRGKVQCIYFDPPYGIKFNSNFQWSTTTRAVKDGSVDHITREPEQVKAFRDTWRDGIHSYLTYLRDRLTLARELLTESGSIFVQIGDENLSRVKELLIEVFGADNVVITIPFQKKAYQDAAALAPVNDYLVWAAKKKESLKFRPLYVPTPFEGDVGKYSRIESPDLKMEISVDKGPADLAAMIEKGWRLVREDYPVVSQDPPKAPQPIEFQGVIYQTPPGRHWSQRWPEGMARLALAGRLRGTGTRLYAREYWTDSPIVPRNNLWTRLKGPSSPNYVVETAVEVVKRCVLMATDPGDLILDPTCGSGTTAYVSEQWGRRWITIDTSRVALALARARIMGGRYPYYLLADSREGQLREAGLASTLPKSTPTHGNIRHGFIYERVPQITLKDVASNIELDVIAEKWRSIIETAVDGIGNALGKKFNAWEIPFECNEAWPQKAKDCHAEFWRGRRERQAEMDSSIAARAVFEMLFDKPFEDKKKVRVAGPFTVESLSPHRTLVVGADDELIDMAAAGNAGHDASQTFTQIILENLKSAGVQQADKSGKIDFIALHPWAGRLICAEGQYIEGTEAATRRAAIFIGPEFGTVSRPDLVEAAREAADGGFDVLIACAFNYEAHTTEFNSLGRIPVLKARMNADLHMADDLKNTGKGNLFVIFGEPDIDLIKLDDDRIQVKVNGVDVFHPQSGEVRSDGPEGIACWFLDTDYNEESFFVRHAYFLGANDPYSALKTTLKAEIDREAWESLNSDTSRPFNKPKNGRIAVKVINHLGDEVMKIFRV